jgi:hypothetical protein
MKMVENKRFGRFWCPFCPKISLDPPFSPYYSRSLSPHLYNGTKWQSLGVSNPPGGAALFMRHSEKNMKEGEAICISLPLDS